VIYSIPSSESPLSEGGTCSTLLPETDELPTSSLMVVAVMLTDSPFGALLETLQEGLVAARALHSKAHPYLQNVLAHCGASFP
jgi:hypothetical protein